MTARRINTIESFLRRLTLTHVICTLSVVLGGSALAVAPESDHPNQAEVPAAAEAAPTQERQPPIAGEEIPVPESGLQAPNAAAPGSEDDVPPVTPAEARLEPDLEAPGENNRQQGNNKDKTDKSHERSRGDHGRGGPPPWAPAHGFRCKRAGSPPGSPTLKRCIQSRKSKKHGRQGR